MYFIGILLPSASLYFLPGAFSKEQVERIEKRYKELEINYMIVIRNAQIA